MNLSEVPLWLDHFHTGLNTSLAPEKDRFGLFICVIPSLNVCCRVSAMLVVGGFMPSSRSGFSKRLKAKLQALCANGK